MRRYCKGVAGLCSYVFALLIVAQAQPAAAHNDARTAYAIPLDGITIDGRLDDWPARMAVYPIAWVSPRFYKPEPPEGPADLTASFRVGYDAGANLLYVAVVARDDDWVIDAEAGSFTNQDLCEIYIDADHSGGDAASAPPPPSLPSSLSMSAALTPDTGSPRSFSKTLRSATVLPA